MIRFALAPRALVLAASALVLHGASGCASTQQSTTTSLANAGFVDLYRNDDRRDGLVSQDSVTRLLSVLADDSMAGRGTGTPGAEKAAKYIAEQMKAIGLEAVGDDGYFQKVPLINGMTGPDTFEVTNRTTGAKEKRIIPARKAMRVAKSMADYEAAPAADRVMSANVVGIIRGTDPTLKDEIVLIDAHYDHVGAHAPRNLKPGDPMPADTIYNGADDDASGVVAVLEIARAMKQGPAPKRTVVFLTTTGEEMGLLGTNWYIDHPIFPLDKMVANLEIEMIGRPDSLAGGPGKGWLTGYERSTMGDMLAAKGIPIVPDKRLEQNFFMRSDNIAFAMKGIPAHTLSSFNLHKEYHTPADDISHVDFAHMTAVIQAAVSASRNLADGPKPEWKPGGRPTPRVR
jgi:hypothetical protein